MYTFTHDEINNRFVIRKEQRTYLFIPYWDVVCHAQGMLQGAVELKVWDIVNGLNGYTAPMPHAATGRPEG